MIHQVYRMPAVTSTMYTAGNTSPPQACSGSLRPGETSIPCVAPRNALANPGTPPVTHSCRLLRIRSKCYEKISIPHLQASSIVAFAKENPAAVTKRLLPLRIPPALLGIVCLM